MLRESTFNMSHATEALSELDSYLDLCKICCRAITAKHVLQCVSPQCPFTSSASEEVEDYRGAVAFDTNLNQHLEGDMLHHGREPGTFTMRSLELGGAIQIRPRQDTAENWAKINPVLLEGEVGIELDTGSVKVGDGQTFWVDLPECMSVQKLFALPVRCTYPGIWGIPVKKDQP